MASARRRYTTQEILDYLDDRFDIPDEGVNSDIEGFDEDRDDDLHFESDNESDDDEELDLRTVDIIEDSDDLSRETESRGTPGNLDMNGLDWSSQSSDLEVPTFTKAVGCSRVMPEGTSALDFFLLFVDNRMMNNMVRETNRYALQTLEMQNKDPSLWKEVTLQELKAFLGLLIAMSIHRLPSLRNYWSSDWVLGVPAFAKIMARNRFLDIWSNLHLSDNTKLEMRTLTNCTRSVNF